MRISAVPTTLYFWKCGEVIAIPVKGQTPRDICKKYRQVPCLRHHSDGYFDHGKYTYLGWKAAGIPTQLKALQLILNV